MVIEKLCLDDFRGIRRLELELKGKNTVLFGINGVGKSSVLAAINLLYANMINRIVKFRFKQAVRLEDTDIRFKKASARIAGEFRFWDESKGYGYWQQVDKRIAKITVSKGLEEIVEHFTERYQPQDSVDEDNNLLEKGKEINIPIYVNYGVNRLVLKTPLRIRKTEDYGQIAAFEKAIESQIAFSKLFEWFLEQELYETQRQKIDSGYQDTALNSVKRAMLAMLDGCSNIHITAKPYSMKVSKGEEVLDILQLSDGEKCTLALFGDMARRLAIANPTLENPLEGVGVVLIDEVELHMHVSWQRKVVNVLKETFPNIQFIITTHSPQVLGEINSDFNVFSLRKEEDDIVCEKFQNYFGLDTNSILEEAFHTSSLNEKVRESVCQMYDCIDRKDFEQAEHWIRIIDQLTGNRNIDSTRGKILVRKVRRIDAANKEKS